MKNEKSKNENAEKIGASVGSGSTVTCIGVAFHGLSAAEITGTLGTIGGLVGGGMAAGIVLVAAAPAAVGGLGYLGVKAAKNIRGRLARKK